MRLARSSRWPWVWLLAILSTVAVYPALTRNVAVYAYDAATFRVPVPKDVPPGEYFVEVGWFNPENGEQLEPQPETVQPPLRILWRSILLPPVQVR